MSIVCSCELGCLDGITFLPLLEEQQLKEAVVQAEKKKKMPQFGDVSKLLV